MSWLVQTAPRRVLLVGTAARVQELEEVLRSERYEFIRSEGPAGVLARLREDREFDAVLLCPNGDLSAYVELCRHVKLDSRTALLPVLLFVDAGDTETRASIFSSGADDYIELPASALELALRINRAVHVKHATDSLEDATAVIASMAQAIEGRDPYTRGHVDRVATYAAQLGRRLGLTPFDVATLRSGGVVHDIGKIAVPDGILNKPGKLTEDEMALIRRHPVIGYDILKPTRAYQHVLPIVRWHHERPNGTGYPDGLHGADIPLAARIVAVADVFDALSTARPYRDALPPDRCRQIMSDAAAAGELDDQVVSLLLETLDSTSVLLGEATPIAQA